MNLRKRLLTQSFTVLLSTVLVTACISLLFGYFYSKVNWVPLGNNSIHTDIVVLKEDEVIYASGNFSAALVQELRMHLNMGHDKVELNGKTFGMDEETFRVANGTTYSVIKVNPVVNIAKGYRTMILFVICVFLIAFLVASLLAQQYNRTHIIEPIVHLKEATEKLTEGDLNIELPDEGEGEVYELHEAIEQLRIKLKDSVYYERKFDENRQFLVSSISHDLKTPVTAIRGYIEGVLDGVAATEEKQSEYLEKALQKTDLIRTMIDDLLLYSKLDLNQVTFERKRISVNEYMESCIDDHRFGFQKEGKQITLNNELNEPAFVMIDTSRFGRVVQNILDNAKKNIAPGSGKVEVIIRRKLHNVILEFCDNGVGIKEEELPHIFDRFYRADSARKIRGSSGLGLAIAKQVVEGLGGRIWATSTYGKGTSILISLKAVPEPDQNQEEND